MRAAFQPAALLQILATLVIGAAGGWVARQLGLPLPWMLGPLIVTTIFAVGRIQIAGRGVHIPKLARNFMIPIIGVMLGASFSPAIVSRMVEWVPTMLALLVFIFLGTAAVYHLYRRAFGFDPTTSYFSAVPGGLIDMAIIGEQLGGNSARITLIHFCRIIIAVITIPFILRIIHGPMNDIVLDNGGHGALGAADVAILAACAVGGYFGARALRFPGAVIAGPVIASAIAHGVGLTSASPPEWLVTFAQIVVGAALGSGFATLSPRELGHGLRAAAAGSVVLACVTVLVAVCMMQFVDEPLASLILAYAPGGVAEMSLIALAMEIGVAFVTTHHIARIVLCVLVMPLAWRLLFAPKPPGSATQA